MSRRDRKESPDNILDAFLYQALSGPGRLIFRLGGMRTRVLKDCHNWGGEMSSWAEIESIPRMWHPLNWIIFPVAFVGALVDDETFMGIVRRFVKGSTDTVYWVLPKGR